MSGHRGIQRVVPLVVSSNTDICNIEPILPDLRDIPSTASLYGGKTYGAHDPDSSVKVTLSISCRVLNLVQLCVSNKHHILLIILLIKDLSALVHTTLSSILSVRQFILGCKDHTHTLPILHTIIPYTTLFLQCLPSYGTVSNGSSSAFMDEDMQSLRTLCT